MHTYTSSSQRGVSFVVSSVHTLTSLVMYTDKQLMFIVSTINLNHPITVKKLWHKGDIDSSQIYDLFHLCIFYSFSLDESDTIHHLLFCCQWIIFLMIKLMLFCYWTIFANNLHWNNLIQINMINNMRKTSEADSDENLIKVYIHMTLLHQEANLSEERLTLLFESVSRVFKRLTFTNAATGLRAQLTPDTSSTPNAAFKNILVTKALNACHENPHKKKGFYSSMIWQSLSEDVIPYLPSHSDDESYQAANIIYLLGKK